MNFKDEKFKIEVIFSKNRACPEYGNEAYSTESHSIYIPYGRKYHFKSSKKTIDYILHVINKSNLDRYDSVSYTIWKGYSGLLLYIKNTTTKSDINPIDRQYAESLFKYK
jgi:hypothetical protein